MAVAYSMAIGRKGKYEPGEHDMRKRDRNEHDQSKHGNSRLRRRW
jgi:hypothetical protein